MAQSTIVDCGASGSKSLKQSPGWKSSGPTPSSGSGPRLAGADDVVAAAGGDVSATGCLVPPPSEVSHQISRPITTTAAAAAPIRAGLWRRTQPPSCEAFPRPPCRPRPEGGCGPAAPPCRAASRRRASVQARCGPGRPRRTDAPGCRPERGPARGRSGCGRGRRRGRPASRRSAASKASGGTADGRRQVAARRRTVRRVRRQGEPQACRRRRASRSLRSLRIHHFRASLPRLDARRRDPFPGVHYGTLSKLPGGPHAAGAPPGAAARATLPTAAVPGSSCRRKHVI